MRTLQQIQREEQCRVGQAMEIQKRERVSCTSVLPCSVPEPFIEAFGRFVELRKRHSDDGSTRNAFKAQECWSKLQKELIAWVELEEQNRRLDGKLST